MSREKLLQILNLYSLQNSARRLNHCGSLIGRAARTTCAPFHAAHGNTKGENSKEASWQRQESQ